MPRSGFARALCAALAGCSLLSGACVEPLQLARRRAEIVRANGDDAPALSAANGKTLSPEPADAVTASLEEPAGLSMLGQLMDGTAGRAHVGEQEFTLEQAVQYALAHHPLLRARQHEVAIAQAKLIDAGILPNPQLVLDVEAAVEHHDPTEMTTRVMFTVPTGGKIARKKAAARAGIQRAQAAVSRETEAVLLEAANAAMEVLYLQELATLHTRFSELAAKGAEVQSERFKIQDATFADKIQADVDAKSTELRRLDTAARLKAAQVRLARAIGQPPGCLPRLEGQLAFEPIPPTPLETLLEVASQTRPELGEAQAAVTESHQQLALAHALALPDFQIGPRYRDRLNIDDDSLGGRFNMDLPIFDRNQGGIAESSAQTCLSGALLEDAQLRTLSDVAAAYTELTSLQTSLQYYESDALPLIERTESTLDEDLQSKVIAESQVSGILEEFVRIRVNHLDLRYRYNRLRTQLEIFLGRRLAELTPCPAEPTLEEVVTPPAEPPSAPAAKPLPAPPRAARPATTVQ